MRPGSAAELYQGGEALGYVSGVSLLGVTALVAGVISLITANWIALALLVGATLALWLAATIRHAFAAPAVPGRDRDTHEVIQPEKTGP